MRGTRLTLPEGHRIVAKKAHLGDLGAQGGVLVWVLQEVHNLLQLQLGTIHSLRLQKCLTFRLSITAATLKHCLLIVEDTSGQGK